MSTPLEVVAHIFHGKAKNWLSSNDVGEDLYGHWPKLHMESTMIFALILVENRPFCVFAGHDEYGHFDGKVHT